MSFRPSERIRKFFKTIFHNERSFQEQRGDEHTEVVKSLFFEFGKCMNQVFDATRQAEKAVIMAAKQDFPLLDDDTDDEGGGIKSEL